MRTAAGSCRAPVRSERDAESLADGEQLEDVQASLSRLVPAHPLLGYAEARCELLLVHAALLSDLSVMPRASQMESNSRMSRRRSPVSYRLTHCWGTPRRDANCCWFMPRSCPI